MSDTIAFILARGGSKRIPRKNIRSFHGLPMIAWPIRAALTSGLFGTVIVSTDDQEIADTAQAFGAQCPSLRPGSLADDFSTTVDVLRYLVQEFASPGEELCSDFCCLYGTSGFVTPEILREGKQLLELPGTECVMAVSQYAHPIERALHKDPTGMLRYRNPDAAALRTQDICASYHDLGLMYWLRTLSFIAMPGDSLSDLRIRPLVVPQHRAVDIDVEDDWAFAEHMADFLLTNKINKNS